MATIIEQFKQWLDTEQPSKEESIATFKAISQALNEYKKRFYLQRGGEVTTKGPCVLCGAPAVYKPAPSHKTYGDVWLKRYFADFEKPASTSANGRNLDINNKPASMVLRYSCAGCCAKFAIAERIHQEGLDEKAREQRALRLSQQREIYEDTSAKWTARWDALWEICEDGTFPEALKTLKYKDFLKTTYWNLVRGRKLWKADYQCQMCSADDKELNVHHSSYDHHGYEYLHLDDLIVLCRYCHAKFHDKLVA